MVPVQACGAWDYHSQDALGVGAVEHQTHRRHSLISELGDCAGLAQGYG
jgi:hypothetical protein